MRIQYASDLHLELWRKTTFEETLLPVAPILILLGDIAILNEPNLPAFLEYCSEKWKQIFWIPGNSEIWLSSETEEISLYKMNTLISPYRNIKVLYKNTYMLEDSEAEETILLVGLSLWHKPRNDVMLHYNNNIYIKPIPVPCPKEMFKTAHESQVKFLERIINNATTPLLICSYYAPFTWLYEEDWIQEPNSALIDRELEKLITYPITAWIVGHNHLPIEYSRRYYDTTGYQGSVLFVSNPRGKPIKQKEVVSKDKDNENPYYRKEAVIRLQPHLLEGFEKEEEVLPPIWARRNHPKS